MNCNSRLSLGLVGFVWFMLGFYGSFEFADAQDRESVFDGGASRSDSRTDQPLAEAFAGVDLIDVQVSLVRADGDSLVTDLIFDRELEVPFEFKLPKNVELLRLNEQDRSEESFYVTVSDKYTGTVSLPVSHRMTRLPITSVKFFLGSGKPLSRVYFERLSRRGPVLGIVVPEFSVFH